ncbi:MAG: hypothetical protein KF780_12360 [Sphingomonas sp.]|nr:hypothetical protein [Sphingomonas sp.]
MTANRLTDQSALVCMRPSDRAAIELQLMPLTARERAVVLACLDALSRPLSPRELERAFRARLSASNAKAATATLKGVAIFVMRDEARVAQ